MASCGTKIGDASAAAPPAGVKTVDVTCGALWRAEPPHTLTDAEPSCRAGVPFHTCAVVLAGLFVACRGLLLRGKQVKKKRIECRSYAADSVHLLARDAPQRSVVASSSSRFHWALLTLAAPVQLAQAAQLQPVLAANSSVAYCACGELRRASLAPAVFDSMRSKRL